MQVSQTYNYEKNDHINRANMALICSQYFGIKDVSPNFYQIAAPVSELPFVTKDGGVIFTRHEIPEAIPWNERSMKTFGVVYRYEATASFIGIDGKTYVVPNDQPVIEHLQECGYVIAPNGANLDGSSNGEDSLIGKEENKNGVINRNLPVEIIYKINELENNRPYIRYWEAYDGLLTFRGSLGMKNITEEEEQQLSLSERKIANIRAYGRVRQSQNIEDYLQFVLQQRYLSQEFIHSKKS